MPRLSVLGFFNAELLNEQANIYGMDLALYTAFDFRRSEKYDEVVLRTEDGTTLFWWKLVDATWQTVK